MLQIYQPRDQFRRQLLQYIFRHGPKFIKQLGNSVTLGKVINQANKPLGVIPNIASNLQLITPLDRPLPPLPILLKQLHIISLINGLFFQKVNLELGHTQHFFEHAGIIPLGSQHQKIADFDTALN